jgi:hypothetical protein
MKRKTENILMWIFYILFFIGASFVIGLII